MLQQDMGVKPETFVAVVMDRSIEAIVSILGILAAGGAYVPIDPKQPASRLEYLLRDSDATAVLTQARHAAKVTAALGEARAALVPVVAMDDDDAAGQLYGRGDAVVESGAHAGSAAYVIYTSGSTGKPKGVVVEHRSAVNYIFALSLIHI